MKNRITVIQDNKKKEYDVLFTLNDENSNLKYAVCTDNTKDKDGNAIISFGKYDGMMLIPVSDDERRMLKEMVDIVQKEVLKNEN